VVGGWQPAPRHPARAKCGRNGSELLFLRGPMAEVIRRWQASLGRRRGQMTSVPRSPGRRPGNRRGRTPSYVAPASTQPRRFALPPSCFCQALARRTFTTHVVQAFVHSACSAGYTVSPLRPGLILPDRAGGSAPRQLRAPAPAPTCRATGAHRRRLRYARVQPAERPRISMSGSAQRLRVDSLLVTRDRPHGLAPKLPNPWLAESAPLARRSRPQLPPSSAVGRRRIPGADRAKNHNPAKATARFERVPVRTPQRPAPASTRC
jgi:hypothetical protein